MTSFNGFFKKDSLVFGLFLGIVVPALVFLLMFVINYFIKIYISLENVIKLSVIHLISLLVTLVPMRFYFIKRYDKTAKGILLCAFVIGILFFVIKY